MSETELTTEIKAEREQQLHQWANSQLSALLGESEVQTTFTMVSGDASFRRYFRLQWNEKTFIAVDAPPLHENSEQFVLVDSLLAEAGVHVPYVHAFEFENGFMLLEDLGDDTYLPFLLELQNKNETERIDKAYKKIIDALIVIQSNAEKGQLGPYDRKALRKEMDLFPHWFCQELLGMQLSREESEIIHGAFIFLEDSSLSQETVLVHRDYHSRNLMLLSEDQPPGIIDFQDAVQGPYTYDLVSVLRDCYIAWPAEQVSSWAEHYLERARNSDIAVPSDIEQFTRDFDLMGLQRHIKVLGIFSRLAIRDNKSRYLADIPLVIQYFMEISSRYPELGAFREWFQRSVLPLAQNRVPSN